MFKNREFRTRVVKVEPEDQAKKEERTTRNILLAHKLVKDDVKYIAILIGLGYFGKKLCDSASTIAVIAADQQLRP